jgi:hypothetical protein
LKKPGAAAPGFFDLEHHVHGTSHRDRLGPNGLRRAFEPRQWVSLAALDRPVPCRRGAADSCRGSPRRASAAPRSAAPLPLPRPRQRLHAEVGVGPVHSQVGQSCPQRFRQSPPYNRGMGCALLPTGTSRSLRDIVHVGDHSSFACFPGGRRRAERRAALAAPPAAQVLATS